MMPAKANLVWNVAYMSWNEKKVVTFNLFEHDYFFDDCVAAYKKYKDDKKSFLEMVCGSLRYYFWSKCEWEMILSAWPPNERITQVKVDVYDQVMLNWDRFSEYVWENREVFKRRRKK